MILLHPMNVPIAKADTELKSKYLDKFRLLKTISQAQVQNHTNTLWYMSVCVFPRVFVCVGGRGVGVWVCKPNKYTCMRICCVRVYVFHCSFTITVLLL